MLPTSLTHAIKQNADYGQNTAGSLDEQEVQSLHDQVNKALATTAGDTGECLVSARQLAILLKAYVVQERNQENQARSREHVAAFMRATGKSTAAAAS
jgi:hypothetical protein